MDTKTYNLTLTTTDMASAVAALIVAGQHGITERLLRPNPTREDAIMVAETYEAAANIARPLPNMADTLHLCRVNAHSARRIADTLPAAGPKLEPEVAARTADTTTPPADQQAEDQHDPLTAGILHALPRMFPGAQIIAR